MCCVSVMLLVMFQVLEPLLIIQISWWWRHPRATNEGNSLQQPIVYRILLGRLECGLRQCWTIVWECWIIVWGVWNYGLGALCSVRLAQTLQSFYGDFSHVFSSWEVISFLKCTTTSTVIDLIIDLIMDWVIRQYSSQFFSRQLLLPHDLSHILLSPYSTDLC